MNRGSFSKIFFLHEANKIAAFLLIPWQKNGTAFNLFILQFVQLTSCAGSASCTYDMNNNVVGITKTDGSVTTTVYDNKQKVTSTVEKTSSGAVITGFEYVYDDLSRITEEKVLANSTKIYYTYDNLGRVTQERSVGSFSGNLRL